MTKLGADEMVSMAKMQMVQLLVTRQTNGGKDMQTGLHLVFSLSHHQQCMLGKTGQPCCCSSDPSLHHLVLRPKMSRFLSGPQGFSPLA